MRADGSTPVEDSDFLMPALRQLAAGADWPAFSAWFARTYGAEFLPGARLRSPAQPEAEASRAARALARELWRLTPDPAHGWRPRTLPHPGRNDPCDCGSGRKYKHCCQSAATAVPPLEINPQSLGGLLFALGPVAWRTPEALRAMPVGLLAPATHAWGETHGPAALVALLEPLFRSPAGLRAEHDDAFEMLQDAMQELGQEAAREGAARALAEHATDRTLRCTGRCRLAVMAADRGEDASAWHEFRQAQRESPDDPQVLHLELTMLLGSGRGEEARSRAPVLAARARRLGYPDLSGVLLRLGEGGLPALFDGPLGQEEIDEEEQAWLALLRQPLPLPDAARFAQFHDIACTGEGAAAQLRVTAARKLQQPLKAWRSRFAPPEPTLTSTWSEADAMLDAPDAVREWLRGHPDCTLAVPVLDDLLLAARDMAAASGAPPVLAAAGDLAFAAAGMVVAALEPWPRAALSWAVPANRPLLRIVAQAIELALERHDEARAEGWMRWMLARNPEDNHGWREVLRQALLRSGDGAGALALLDAYPHDVVPAGHDRALALFLLERREQAEAVLRYAHDAHPGFVPMLLPDAVDRPDAGAPGFLEVGSPADAWEWRMQVREGWVRSGALDWLRSLALPQPAARKKRPAAAGRGKGKAGGKTPALRSAAAAGAPTAKELGVLQRHYGPRLPWLLGWLAANAWAPGLVIPAQWAPGAIEQASGLDDGRSVDALLAAVMNQYNAFNEQRLAAAPGAPVPLPPALPAGDDAAWAGFAAGFLQAAETHGAAVWRAAGAAVGSAKGPFAPLRQLAARAPAGPDGWRATGEAGQPLLALAGDQPDARDLLAHALQPLWVLALAARD